MRRSIPAALYVILAVSALLLTVGASMGWTRSRPRSEEGSVVATARVARLTRTAGGTARARVGYSVAGRPVAATVDAIDGMLAVGDEVRVRYPADAPSDAWVDGAAAPRPSLVPAILLVVLGGGGLLLCAHNLPIVQSRLRKQELKEREDEWKAIVDALEARSRRRG